LTFECQASPRRAVYTVRPLAYTVFMDNTVKKIPEKGRHTYADYKAWELDPGERYEIIGGEAYAMSAPNDFHQAIVAELSRQFGNFLHGKPCKVRPSPYDVRLFFEEDESDDTVVQPDLSVICDEQKRGPEGGRGAPDLIVEVLSPSNSSEEYVRKFNLYLEAGVREYWVVAPKSKTVQVFVLEDDAYKGTVYNSSATVSSKALAGLSVTLTDVFAG
jgi:Uma2 family endonuclease